MAPEQTAADYLEKEILILLAGRCGERRGRRWRPHPDRISQVALHESCHAVVAAAVGQSQRGIAIARDGTRGVMFHASAAAPPLPPIDLQDPKTIIEAYKPGMSDFEQAVDFAKLMKQHGWGAYLRGMWKRADVILERHWLAATILASEVRERRIVGPERVQQILDRWMPVTAPSLSAFLNGSQQTGATT